MTKTRFKMCMSLFERLNVQETKNNEAMPKCAAEVAMNPFCMGRCRLFRAFATFCVTVFIWAFMLPTTAFAATEVQDGMIVTLSTYVQNDNAIIADVTLENTNAFAVENVSLESIVPDGYVLSDESRSRLAQESLAPGEKCSLEAIFFPKVYPGNSEEGDSNAGSSDTNTALPNGSISGADQQSGTSATTTKAMDTPAPATGDDGIAVPMILFLLSSAIILLMVGIRDKNKRRMLSLILCVAVIGTQISAGLPAHAENRNNRIEVSETVIIEHEDVTVKAVANYKLPAGKVTVTFDSDGGTAVPSQTIPIGAKAEKPTDPVKEGYTFSGWYQGEMLYDFNAQVVQDIRLTAKWESTDNKNPDDDMANGGFSSVDIYAITALEVDLASNTAKATVSAPGNCALVVRFIDEEIYFSEDYPSNKSYLSGGTLYASHVVSAGSDMAEITAKINGSLPEYYVAEAVLLDSSGSELCAPFSTIEHTERYHEYTAKTVYDFPDAPLVLNFDDVEDDNFGVLADDVKILTADSVVVQEHSDGDQIVPRLDYLIQNPSGDIYAGDKIFICDENGEYIFKANEIISDSDGLHIQVAQNADENEVPALNDFYSFIKVDMQYDLDANADPEMETASQQPGKLLDSDASCDLQSETEKKGFASPDINEVHSEDFTQIRGINIKRVNENATGKTSLPSFTPSFTTEHFSLSGKLGMNIEVHVALEWDIILFGEDYMKCEVSATNDFNIPVSIKAKFGTENNEQLQEELKNKKESTELSFGKFSIPVSVTGLSVFADIKFAIEWKLNAGLTFDYHSKTTNGFIYCTKEGRQTIDKKEQTYDIRAEGFAEIKIGPKPSVGIDFAGGAFSASVSAFIGAKVQATAVIPVFEDGPSRHDCNLCIDGNVKTVLSVDAKFSYKITNKLKGDIASWNLLTLERPVFDFYGSILNNPNSQFHGKMTWGQGSCPNKSYRVDFQVQFQDGSLANNNEVKIVSKDQNDAGNVITAKSGSYVYLPKGSYAASTILEGIEIQTLFTVSDGAKQVILARGAGDCSVSGSVLDGATKEPIPNATVKVFEYTTPVIETKSNDSGTYRFSLGQGTYKLVIEAENYITSEQYFTLKNDENKILESMLMAGSDADRIMGGVYGIITDASTGLPISDAKIEISHGWNTSGIPEALAADENTNDGGEYAYRKNTLFGVDFGLNAGNYTVTVSKEGYITSSFNITIVGGSDMEFNGSLTPIGDDNVYRIVLRWGEEPEDLDSHIRGTVGESDEHVFFDRMNGEAADLDVDDITSYGPETIKITDIQEFAGDVYYSVHDYTNRSSDFSDALSRSGATVEIFRGSELIESFYVPSGVEGTVWNVFSISPQGKIVPINTFEYVDSPDDVLSDTVSPILH